MKRYFSFLLIFVLIMSFASGAWAEGEGGEEPCEHELTPWEIKKSPTCNDPGLRERNCTKCDFSETEPIGIDPNNHDWDAGTITTQPNYSIEGEKTFTCQRCEHTKTEPVPRWKYVESITVTGDTTVTVGGTVQLSATALPEDAHDRSISWSSSDNSIVTVNQSGLVSAVAAGTAVIKATAYDGSGVYAPVSITSTAPARTITVTYAPGLYGAGTAPASSTTTTGSVTLPGASFTRSGYSQSGWSVNIAGDVGTYSLSATIPVTADMTLYPYWTSVTPQLYYVTYEKGTYGTGTTVTSSAVSLGSQLKLFDKGFFTRTGFVQDGWSISPDGTMADYALQGTITLYGPITLYPHWTAESANRTIYVDYSDNGSVYYGDVKVSKGQTLTITPGKTITLSFKPNDKYYVYNVNVSGYNYSSRDSYTFSYDEMNANKSIFVRFESVYVNPKTGDDSNVFLWAVLGLSAVACGAGSFAVVLKKREE